MLYHYNKMYRWARCHERKEKLDFGNQPDLEVVSFKSGKASP
jgi:hypothetical protein